MDYYDILEINKNATLDDIKKAYKKLALKHHPDKGGDIDKFRQISEAYSVLSNKSKKIDNDINDINDINVDIFELFNKFFTNINDITMRDKGDDLCYNIYVNLEDIYLMKTKQLKIIQDRFENGRLVKKEQIYDICTYEKEVIFNECGNDMINTKKRGDLIITIYPKKINNIKIINDYDLIYEHHVNLYDIKNGFSYKYIHIDKKEYIIICPSIGNYLHQKIEEKGLYNGTNRGNLYMRYIIHFEDKLEEHYMLNMDITNNKNEELNDEIKIFPNNVESYDEIYN